mmetsp:Transcript_48095/g.70260  ORF Transcript_48095/g.70260 Transcript_48095/m.70260 type:complete len:93 (-) Transcript_48095:72-350(-)
MMISPSKMDKMFYGSETLVGGRLGWVDIRFCYESSRAFTVYLWLSCHYRVIGGSIFVAAGSYSRLLKVCCVVAKKSSSTVLLMKKIQKNERK